MPPLLRPGDAGRSDATGGSTARFLRVQRRFAPLICATVKVLITTPGAHIAQSVGAPSVAGFRDSAEFGERCGEQVMRCLFGRDFVVSAAEVLHERVTGRDGARGAQRLSPRIGRSLAFRRP
jgi:hypothetical protein